jgi:hypothetical protein
MNSEAVVAIMEENLRRLREESRSKAVGLISVVRVSAPMVRRFPEYRGYSMFEMGMDLARRSGTTLLPPKMQDEDGPAETLDEVLSFRLWVWPLDGAGKRMWG